MLSEPNLITVLTVRLNSSRLPQKGIKEVSGKPIMTWIAKRLQSLPGMLVIATTIEPSDDPIIEIGKELNIPVWRGPINDVVKRMDQAISAFMPDAQYVFRALGDCPFIETDFVARAIDVMARTKSEAFLWHLAPETWPVYGAREFPYSRSAWNKINNLAKGDEREHIDLYFHRNRSLFKIVYHQPPPFTYFRPYRLEIDWFEDYDLIKAIAEGVGMDAQLSDIIDFLDKNDEISRINRERVEKTGPMSSYAYSQRRAWMKAMNGKPVTSWTDTIWKPPGEDATPVFCSSGKCMVGYGDSGVLYTKAGDRISGNAFINCTCGAGKYWKQPRARKI